MECKECGYNRTLEEIHQVRMEKVLNDLITNFQNEVYKIEKFNQTHGNAYIGGMNYILPSQAIKVLKKILKPSYLTDSQEVKYGPRKTKQNNK